MRTRRLSSSAHALMRGPVRLGVRRAQGRHPTVLAPGTQAGPPDFVGIGAQRCGTSWWQSLIEQHPRVDSLGLGAKELNFFDSPWSSETAAETAALYAGQFRRRPGQLIGEWTPRYMWDPWAVPALNTVAPEAKLLVMLRDPAARFRSGLGHEVKSAKRLTQDGVNAAFSRGLYAAQLDRVLRSVPRERLLVLQFERCVAEPVRHLARTFEFLGLDDAPIALERGERNPAVASLAVAPGLMRSAREAYRDDADRLARLFPDDVDLDLWTTLFGAGPGPDSA